MKYPLFLLALIVHFFNTSAQDTSYYNSNWKPCSQSIATYVRISKIGNSGYKVKDYYYPSMAIQMTGTYEDKKLEYKTGDFFYYTQEGKINQYAYFEMDELNDWNVFFNKEGKPVDSSFYVRGSIEKKRFYHYNNYLWFEQNYKNSLLNDTTFTFFPNGKIKRVEVYKDGKLEVGYCLDSNRNKMKYTPLLQNAEFPGGKNAMYEWLNSNLVYPKSRGLKGIEGKVIISFTIDTFGNPTNYVIEESNDQTFSDATKYLVDIMPNWTPANLDGEKINFNFTLPIRFAVDQQGRSTFDESTQLIDLYINGEPVLTEASEMPEFIGGDEKMYEYIQANLKYPELALENKIEGNSIVSFIVLNTGELTDVKAVKKIGWEMDREAIRIIKSMPKWKPGKMNGEPAHVRFTVPVKFRINQINEAR